MIATHIYSEKYLKYDSLAKRSLKAMSDICGYKNGTIKNPVELASAYMSDGRTLIQTIYEDGEVYYNDGWFIVEVNEFHIYVDITAYAVREMTANGEIKDGKYQYIYSKALEPIEE